MIPPISCAMVGMHHSIRSELPVRVYRPQLHNDHSKTLALLRNAFSLAAVEAWLPGRSANVDRDKFVLLAQR